MIIKTHFHINGFVLSLSLKQRLEVTRKWPISQDNLRKKGAPAKINIELNLNRINRSQSFVIGMNALIKYSELLARYLVASKHVTKSPQGPICQRS